MRCLCIGICQIMAVSEILKSCKNFTEIYDDIICYTIFSITVEEMQNIIDNILPTCHLVLSQPVSENYRDNPIFSTSYLKSKLSTTTKHYVLANCYFTGYDPIPFQTTDLDGNIMHLKGISYFPSISLESLLEKNILQACKDWCNIDIYSKLELVNNYQRSIDELIRRENKIFDTNFIVDIKISDYIVENYRSQYLFHTYNHPTNILLFELTRRILNKLAINIIDLSYTGAELLGDNSIPPPISVYLKMGMEFKYPSIIINKKYHSTFNAMTYWANILMDVKNDKLTNNWIATIKYGRKKLQL